MRGWQSIRFGTTAILIFLKSILSCDIQCAAQSNEYTDSVGAKDNIIQRIIKYFDESNKPKEYKNFDFSIIGGPHYCSDTKFGVGLVAAGAYRTSLADSLTTPSNVSLYGDFSTSGFYLLGLKGNHIFPFDKYRINYNLYFYSFPTKYWGIGYSNGRNNMNETDYDDFRIQLRLDFYMHIADGLYVGPGITFDWIKAKNIEDKALWNGLPLTTTDFGLGIQARWDTRDNLTAPEKGWLIGLNQKYFPKGLINNNHFGYTDFQANHYHKVWEGCVIAGCFHTKYSYGDVPWGMLPTFGGSSTMRGYYEGRYRDKGEMDFTLELRQHIWRRNGLVVWAGVGTVFPKWSGIRFNNLLPNGGVGYRWEFKKHSNVRLDFGIGKGETGFIFNIDEAF